MSGREYSFLIHCSYLSTTVLQCLLSACPDRFDMIDDMMIEYQGREEVLLSNLSSMLATKIRPLQSTDTAATTEEVKNELDHDDSSLSSATDSSDWSSDDGFSSVDASTDTSDAGGITAAELAATEYALTKKSQVTGDSDDSSKPNLIPVETSSSSAGDVAIDKEGAKMSPSWGGATRNDIDEAIEAGDWMAVGTTAALIANVDASEREDVESLGVSKMSFDTHEKNQVEKFEQLVEEGNWEAVMAAASRFETASDLGSLNESRHSMDDSLTSHEETPSEFEGYNNLGELRAEIKELVRAVVPDELSK